VLVFSAAYLTSGQPRDWLPALDIDTLIRWGANGAIWTQNGEWWRLLASRFVIQNGVVLAIDSWALWSAGQILERRLGPNALLLVFFGSAIVAGLATLAFNPPNYIVSGGAVPVFSVLGAIIGHALARRGLPQRRELRPLRFSGPVFALSVLGFIVWGRIDIPGISVGFLAGVLLGLALTPGDSTRVPARAAHWGLAGAIVFIGAGLAWTQLKRPPFVASDAEATLARLKPLSQQQARLDARLRTWWLNSEEAKPPYKAELDELELRQLPEWKRLQAALRDEPSAPGSAGAHYLPQGRENVDRTVRRLEAATESLRAGDQGARKRARDQVYEAILGTHDVRDLALIRDPDSREEEKK
jgi:membrane associated rhomboid family serine protease